jgi:hypothetical protein
VSACRAAVAALTCCGLLCALCLVPAAPAAADSFTPVRLTVTIAPVARLHARLAVTVNVSADPGALDTADGPLRIGVKIAGECGGTFGTTPGDTLLNAQLAPQPATGHAYSATAAGSGRPSAYGLRTVCVYLQDTDVGRLYANDESVQVDVSRSCTAAASRYQSAATALARARRRLRRTHRAAQRRHLTAVVAHDRRTVSADRRRARAACGSGVPL